MTIFPSRTPGKAGVYSSFNTKTVWEQHPRSHDKGATDANATGSKGRFELVADGSCPLNPLDLRRVVHILAALFLKSLAWCTLLALLISLR